jgi:hypothetical protein
MDSRVSALVPRNGNPTRKRGADCNPRFESALKYLPPRQHSVVKPNVSGVNACYADGSIRFVSETVDFAAWQATGSRAGGEVNVIEN